VDSSRGYFSIPKVKNFLQMVSVGAFFLLIAIGSSLTPPVTSRFIMFALTALPYICIWGLWLALGASWWSGATYTFDFLKRIKNLK
jgi:phosphatidylglycerophosphate synthase